VIFDMSTCFSHTFLSEIDLGVEQAIDKERGEQVKARIEKAKKYVEERIAKDPKQRYLLEGCKLNHANCAFWGVIGTMYKSASLKMYHFLKSCS